MSNPCTVRLLEEPDLHRRPTLPRSDRALDCQCADDQQIFETWIDTHLAPTLSPGDVVVFENVAFHKSSKAEAMIKARGARLLFLPVCSPDLNPTEMAFSILKMLLRKHVARTFDAITQALGDICDFFSITERLNYFNAAGYEEE